MLTRTLRLLLAAAASASACHTADPIVELSCGTLRCDPHTSYCETIMTDVRAWPSNYACRPLPSSCRSTLEGDSPDCGCFPSGTRGDFCTASRSSGVLGFHRTTVGGR